MASGVTTPTAAIILPPTVGQATARSLPEFKQQLDTWTRKLHQALSALHSNVTTLQVSGGGGGSGYTHANFLADFAAETTDSLTEGATNLYFSDSLVYGSLSALSPLLFNGASGIFSIQQANASEAGYLSAADWITFNSKGGTFTVSSPLVLSSGVSGVSGLSIQQATTSQSGYLSSTDWNTFNNKFPYNKAVRSVLLCSAFTPFVVGADVGEVTIPYNGDGTSETFTFTRLVLRVGTAGGAPQIRVELSTATGVFSPSTVGVVTLSSGANEGSTTAGFTTTTCASGNKLRFNVLALGTAQNWSVQVEILPQ